MWDALQQWVEANGWLWWALVGFSSVSLVVAIIAMPWLVAQVRADYFLPRRDDDESFGKRHPAARWAGRVLKNLAGIFLVLLGVIWLVTPGQGLAAILAGLFLMDFPGKRRFELWVVRQPRVLEVANWLRAKAGSEPFLVPPARVPTDDPGSTGG